MKLSGNSSPPDRKLAGVGAQQERDVVIPRSRLPSSTASPSGSASSEDEFYDSEDDEEEDDTSESITNCSPCPVVRPTFLCGADNRTYSSLCRLDYHNCIHATAVGVACKGFCPCKANFPGACQTEVRWMFGHLDRDADQRLSLHELYGLEHDQSEKCMKPFLDSCDTDLDVFVSPDEWCRCFEKTERPCEAVKRGMSPKALREVYVPDCDKDGFFRPVQCGPTGNVCWCVDKHGVAVAGTRIFGKPSCDEVLNKPNKAQPQSQDSNQLHEDSDDDEDDDDDSDVEGSADQPLDF
ncbi:hypothetical protein FOCC_FOCC003990 [Frankliniella occidentalis]|nr:hypothetical protein FOCC_FOCC003990 [Frankliniella occidentalis]